MLLTLRYVFEHIHHPLEDKQLDDMQLLYVRKYCYLGGVRQSNHAVSPFSSPTC